MTLAIAYGIVLACLIVLAIIFALPLLRWLAVIAWVVGLFLSPAVREVSLGLGIFAAAVVGVWLYAAKRVELDD